MKNHYLITGATGLIGSALVGRLVNEQDTELTCPVRDLAKVEALFEPDLKNKINWVYAPNEEYLNHLDRHYDYIIHCASPTSSRFFIDHPVETLSYNISSLTFLLNYTWQNKIKSIVYLSSLEVYGSVPDDSAAITEDIQGYVNPLETRSSYNMAKRICESLCYAYYAEYNVPVKIVRLTQTVPGWVGEDDMRLFSQFAHRAAKGEDIELHTDGTSARPYIQIEDALDAILCVLYHGRPGEAYNAANEDTYISAKDLAHFIQDNYNPSGSVVYKLRKDLGYAPTTRIKLDTSKLRSLGWRPKYGLSDMFGGLIEQLKLGLR